MLRQAFEQHLSWRSLVLFEAAGRWPAGPLCQGIQHQEAPLPSSCCRPCMYCSAQHTMLLLQGAGPESFGCVRLQRRLRGLASMHAGPAIVLAMHMHAMLLDQLECTQAGLQGLCHAVPVLMAALDICMQA